MKLQFDPNQRYQLDAVAAVVDLFDGQPQGASEFSILKVAAAAGETLFAGRERTELGIGNRLLLADEKLHQNVRAVQLRNDVGGDKPDAPLDAWDLFDVPANVDRRCPHFSVEMETGTGKTYVYLRTIYELSRKYGFQKFVIVVPSVAIREGVLKNLEITADHFRFLFDNQPFEHFVYDARNTGRLRQFAMSSMLQILVINIDAFRRNFVGTEAELRSNVIYKESDRLSGRQPIEFVQAARPIVIIDEPQSVDSTEKAQEAIRALNPLCTLRYSATHRDLHNLVYRLDPVRAFELNLVKQIVVAGASTAGGADDAFVRVEKIEYKNGIKAKLRIHVQAENGPKERSITVKHGTDLMARSNERACYADGFQVTGISADPGNEFISFSNGRLLKLGEEIGGMRDDLWRAQIKHTIKKHLEHERWARQRGVKVLSLFFIDRVANYRSYDVSGATEKGKFAKEFESVIAQFAQDETYADIAWLKEPIERLHNGYFAQDKKGTLKDTRGDTLADDDIYNLIMKEKERLLSFEEPLRFIFSHSALREGWDNPNVFQICTLNETRSGMRKRQEIGRGLRLPVDQEGRRVVDESLNRLLVMANESYEDFARALQSEYEDDCGVTFGKIPPAAFARLIRVLDGTEVTIGITEGEAIRTALIEQKLIDTEGRIQPGFDPSRPGFSLTLPENHRDVSTAVFDLLDTYRIERHVRRDATPTANPLRKEVLLNAEFQELWNRIKPRTQYRVEFRTDNLVSCCLAEIRRMPRIEAPKVVLSTGRIQVKRGGVDTRASSVSEERIERGDRPIPDLIAYLQTATDLTRSTIVQIITRSGRLHEFFTNPQSFMDAIAGIIQHELHRVIVDGIRYEKLSSSDPNPEWEMREFEAPELVDQLNSLLVKKSIHDFVTYDSAVERSFARRLDERPDIKLFVKLPRWFTVDTPLGTYNPDWAIVKDDGPRLYLVRETKSTKDFLKLRTLEADKVRCGRRHFEALNVPFDIATSDADV